MDQAPIKKDIVNLTCQATGDPFPTISWHFNNSLVNESDKYKISTKLLNYTTSTSTLTVKHVGSSDMGRYICYATNGASTATSYGIISVNGECVNMLINYVAVTVFIRHNSTCSY